MKNGLKIVDKNKFSKDIFNLISKNKDDTCMEIIMKYAEENNIDLDMIPHLLSPRIKSILYKEASEKNVFRKDHKSIEMEFEE